MKRRKLTRDERYGRLTISGEPRERRNARGRLIVEYPCLCNCGNSLWVVDQNLTGGNTQSCGCKRRDSMAARALPGRNSRAYSIWKNMKQRCLDPDNVAWEYYGGRGISVCERWLKFDEFYADMGDPPDGYWLERIDNSRCYSPENCEWAAIKKQMRNRRSSRFLEFLGKSQTVSDWADELGIHKRTILSRLRLGWTVERALSSPAEPNPYDHSTAKKRRAPTLSEKTAAILCLLKRGDGSLLIPLDVQAKGVKAVLAHVEWDHVTPVANGGSNHPINLQPLTKADHKAKTKRDVKAIAKGKRLERRQKAHREAMAAKLIAVDVRGAKDDGAVPRRSKWPSRPFPGSREDKRRREAWKSGRR